MANVTTNDRFWKIDTAAEINGIGVQTRIRMLVFVPAAIDNAVVIQEYTGGALDQSAEIQANHTDINPVIRDYGNDGREFNGFKVSSISAGTLYVYVGRR